MSESERTEGGASETNGRSEVGFGETLLDVEGLTKHFQQNSGFLGGLTIERNGGMPRPTYDRTLVRAVEDVSFDIRKGETLAH